MDIQKRELLYNHLDLGNFKVLVIDLINIFQIKLIIVELTIHIYLTPIRIKLFRFIKLMDL